MDQNFDNNHNCGCGCNHSHSHDEMQTITITLEDDTELECGIIGHFNVNEIDYIALLPEAFDEVLIYRYTETEDFVDIENIESDEEFLMVSEVFQSILDEEDEENEEIN